MNLFRVFQARKLLVLCCFSVLTILVIVSINRSPPINDLDRKYRLEKIDQLIHSKGSSLACKQPKLPVYSPEMMKFVHESPPIDCSQAGIDWVRCEDTECYIREQAKKMYGRITCHFYDYIRENDFDSKLVGMGETDSFYKLRKSDVVFVSCKSQSHEWKGTLTGIRADKSAWNDANWDTLPKSAAKYNVLMFGFDSISRNTFERKLPKSSEYLTKVLGGHILKGYNIVGDGTPQALIPILTGKTELELPDTRKRLPNTKFVNSYPFIWNDYKAAGYVTGFFEDVPELSTFTYRLNGFDEAPTDHYMRPYYLATLKERSKWPKYCNGDTKRHQIMFNHIKDFYSVYKSKPKFLFGFHGELSHDDYNLIGAADEDFRQFLKELKQSGALEDTILILMADHGHRFAEIRNTIQGKQEERLPFFSFTFPKSFKQHFPVAYDNFRSNIDKLTTPFDIHATLKSLLEFNNIGEADISKRAVSLFTKIPARRSCVDAYIEPHWCACLEWHEVPLSSPLVNRIAESLISTLNEYTEPHRGLCEVLRVHEIHWVMRMTPNDNLVKFSKNADLDGFVADLSAKMEIKSDIYQIKVTLMPGSSIFEASVTHLLEEDKLQVKLTDVSRVNLYGTQARCVENEFPHLRKYCYCRD